MSTYYIKTHAQSCTLYMKINTSIHAFMSYTNM